MTVPIYIPTCSVLFSISSPFPFLFVIFISVRWFLILVLKCISLMISTIEYLFKCLLAISIYSLVHVISNPLPIFNQVFFIFFQYWVVRAVYIFWILTPHVSCPLKILSLIQWSVLWRRQWQPTPVLLAGESQGRGSLVGCRSWGRRVGHDWSDLAAAAAACPLVFLAVSFAVQNLFSLIRSHFFIFVFLRRQIHSILL